MPLAGSTHCHVPCGHFFQPMDFCQGSGTFLDSGAHRWGEARHPGPDRPPIFQVSFTNPSGLRNKEATALSQGEDVFSYAETQLSAVTQKSCAAQFRFLAASQNRHVRLRVGAAVPPRSTSEWAGGWSGVATTSDHPSQEVCLPYGKERECGLVLVTRHYLGATSFLNAVVYGYARGPTWPQAEVVLGYKGPRVIGGGYNVDSEGLPIFNFWRSLGWVSARDYAHRAHTNWNQPKSFTCKHATERDLIWLSPEAAAACQWVDVANVFFQSTRRSQLVWPCLGPLLF